MKRIKLQKKFLEKNIVCKDLIENDYRIWNTEIHQGQVHYLIRYNDKDIWIKDDNRIEVIDDLPQNKLRKIAIFKNKYKLSPYWTIRLLNKRRVNAFAYKETPMGLYLKINSTTFKNCDIEHFNVKYLMKDLGPSISQQLYDNVVSSKLIINKESIYQDREDSSLLQIAKELNDENIIKVVSIPKNIPYIIKSGLDNKEYIKEKGRVWY